MVKLISKLLLTLIVFLAAQELNAQNNTKNNSFSDRIVISISTFYYNGLEVNNTGDELLNSKPGIGFEAGAVYSKVITNDFYISAGVVASIYPAPFEYQVGTIKSYDDDYMPVLLNLPVSGGKLVNLTSNWFANVEAGFKLNYILQYPFEKSFKISSGTGDDEQLELDFSFNNIDKKLFISYFAKLGIVNLKSSGNSVGFNFVFNYSPAIIGKGEYKFYNQPNESYGTIEMGLNYIGIEFVYGFGVIDGF